MTNIDFTNGIKIGDIITGYHKGYHRVTKIERRFATQYYVDRYPDIHKNVGDEYNALIHYVPVLDSNGKPTTRKTPYCCDSIYCKNITDSINKEINELQEKINRLTKFRDSQ